MRFLNTPNFMSFRRIKTNFLVFLGRSFTKLPYGYVVAIGRLIGRIFYWIPNSRKKIALKNIELCFQDLSGDQQSRLLKNNLISTGQGLAETLMAYWSHEKKFSNRFKLIGIENIDKALAQNRGCILLSYHHHLIELATRVINQHLEEKKAHMLVRQHNNKDYEHHVDLARRNHCEKTIDKKDMKSVLKSLKGNHPVFYIPDQNFSYQFEYINFFGQPAATVIAPARIAQSTKSPVIPWSAYRKGSKNIIEIGEPLTYFNESETTETLGLMNKFFENCIKQNPEQYLWVHKRFKNHPKGKNHVYEN